MSAVLHFTSRVLRLDWRLLLRLCLQKVPSVVDSGAALTSDIVVTVLDVYGSPVRFTVVALVPLQSDLAPTAFNNVPIGALGGLVSSTVQVVLNYRSCHAMVVHATCWRAPAAPEYVTCPRACLVCCDGDTDHQRGRRGSVPCVVSSFHRTQQRECRILRTCCSNSGTHTVLLCQEHGIVARSHIVCVEPGDGICDSGR